MSYVSRKEYRAKGEKMMEYAIAVIDNSPEIIKNGLEDHLNHMSKDRWKVSKVWATYRETQIVVLFERMRIE